jgi:hypothetical protein
VFHQSNKADKCDYVTKSEVVYALKSRDEDIKSLKDELYRATCLIDGLRTDLQIVVAYLRCELKTEPMVPAKRGLVPMSPF